MRAPMPFVYVGIALLAGSILMLEIALTRVFAVMMWHHMTHMVISITLLGFGAAGSLLTMQSAEPDTRERTIERLSFWSVAYGLSVIACLALATRIPIDTLELLSDGTNFVALGAIYALVAVPFLCGGVAIGLALSRLAAHVDRLYFFDLAGSALGGLVCVAILGAAGSTTTVLTAALLGTLSGTCFALGSPRRAAATLPAVALAAAALLAIGTGFVEWRVPFAPGKEFGRAAPGAEVERIPSSTAEVDVSASGLLPRIMGGNFGRLGRGVSRGRFVGQDGTAPTMLYEGGAHIEEFDFLDDNQANTAYEAFEARGGRAPEVLVIGVGGGIDVMVALAYGAPNVTAVEVNAGMIEMVTERFDDYLGGLFHGGGAAGDRVRLVHGEGRSFVRGEDRRFDVIQLSGVDSFTALSTGAYTLSESYLYTKEAIRDFYEHLEDGGYVNYSRVILTYPRRPRESLRLANIARAALEELGVPDPTRQIAVFRGHDWASTIVKKGAFSREEVEAWDRFAAAQGFWGITFDPLDRPHATRHPGVPYEEQALRAFERAVGRERLFGAGEERPPERLVEALAAAYRLGLEGDDAAVTEALRELTAPIGDPSIALAVRRLVHTRIEEGLAAEEAFQQTRDDFDSLLRGSWAERKEFRRGYQYDVSPTDDDSPFFFNYYRYGWILQPGGERPVDLYWSDYPVGHAVLIASLVQISGLAALLILLPLRTLRRRGVETPNRLRVFGYFAGLGAGFMFVEIVLMQRMVLYLGHPTYAITVVLAALLAAAGTGSLLAGRIGRLDGRTLGALGAAVAIAITAHALLGQALFEATIGWSFAARVAVVVATLVPLGLLLGMPFPLGIRILDDESPSLLPWAWAINGFLSVFSSIFCIVLAMGVGFTRVLLAAAVIYAAGFLGMATRRRPGAA